MLPDPRPRDELGGVDFPYGVPGSPEKQYSDGYGLSHIDAKHPGALNRLPDVISRGDVYEHDVEPDKKRYVILGNEIAIVKRKGGGRAAGWIATSYEENPKKVALYKEAKRVTSRF